MMLTSNFNAVDFLTININPIWLLENQHSFDLYLTSRKQRRSYIPSDSLSISKLDKQKKKLFMNEIYSSSVAINTTFELSLLSVHHELNKLLMSDEHTVTHQRASRSKHR